MDLHHKFQNSPTIDLTSLSTKGNSKSLIKELMNSYDKELSNGKISTNCLKIYHMILCNEYQSKKVEELPVMDNLSISCFEMGLFSQLQEFPIEQMSIIYEIIILKLIHYPENIFNELVEFRKYEIFFEEKETRLIYMKILECFLDAFRMLLFSNPKFEKPENLSIMLSKDLETWYKSKENDDDSEWKSLISILPKLIEVTGFESLNLVWNLLQEENDLKNSLTGLCVFVNFILEAKVVLYEREKLFPFVTNDKFWAIILAGLKSRVEWERKQALYLFKLITEFLKNQQKAQSQELEKKISKIPFTCEKNSDSINLVRNNFIIILESLEEKKQHLVLPSFSILNHLIPENEKHRNCGNCFDFPWLSCIFEKILHHENNAVIKSGMSYILKMNPEYFDYDNDFINSLAKALNNRFLYESEDNKSLPRIVKELENLFNQAQTSKLDFSSKFLSAISEISWDPVSIFYVTLALSSVDVNSHFSWKRDQLMKLKILIETNLKLHSLSLRKESQINTVVAMTRFTKEIDLKILANFLSAFPNEDGIFSRNSKSWMIVSDWLKDLSGINGLEVEKYIRESCENIRDGFSTNTESFARIVLILCDSRHLKRESKTLMNVIDLLSYIQSIKSRPYINIELANQVLELIYHFVVLTNTYSDISWEMVFPFLNSALNFLLISGKKMKLSYENVQKYSAILNILIKKLIDYKCEKVFFNNYEDIALFYLQNTNHISGLQRLYGVNILQIFQEFVKNGFLNPDIISLLLKVYTIPLTFEEEEKYSGVKGKATTEYYTVISKIINCHLEKKPDFSENWILHSSTLFDKAGISGVPFIIGILSVVLEKKIISEKNFDQAKLLIKACWKSIFAIKKKNRLFWIAYDKLLKLMLSPECLGYEENLVHEFINVILKEGEATPNLRNEFLKNLENLDSKWLSHFQEEILDCLLHGQVLRRDARIELQAHAFLSKVKFSREIEAENQLDLNYEFHLNHNHDLEIRARAIVFLLKAINFDANYSMSIFPFVIKKLEKFKGKRYFSDSNSHRIQQRIFQVLLILEPVLNEECTETLRKEIVEIVLSNAADQPSVQIMMSWILSRIYLRNDNDKISIWNFFKEVKEKRQGNIKFVAGVILQISKILNQDDESSKNFFKIAISYLAPECLGPTFNTRFACQMILAKLYERMQEKDILYRAIVETFDERNLQNVNEFYYNNFHLLQNYSLQSIYYQVPGLTNVSEDELIPPAIFKALQFSESKTHPLKLLNESKSLNNFINIFPSDVKSAEKNEITSHYIALDTFDLQKKIVPQKSKIFHQDHELDLNRKNSKSEAIIVVASLVERVPNLGGIARTCEVFGASELILGNKKCTENKEFQSLSVTAEKWIKVTQIAPPDLPRYLLEMKDKDWKIVGLEQTAHSSSLLTTNFEKKTILLLGNEKDGIPPHLIPILDTCVEIPQIGIIRSLNVHVTGAICVWEYAKQHSFI